MKHKTISFAKEIADKLKPIYAHEQERQQVAWWFLQAVTEFDDAQLLAQETIELTTIQEKILADWLDQHVSRHMPLQYILGWVPFGSLKIAVRPPVLIPRPETEEWSFRLANQLTMLENKKIKILDLCTGTGCIALALAAAAPEATIIATDINQDAIELAKTNAKINKITNVSFLNSDVYSAITSYGPFDLIVANPPYITELEWSYLDALVKNWEDHNALVALDNGLAIIKQIIKEAPAYLQKNNELKKNDIGSLYIEIGYSQGALVKQLMEDGGFSNVQIEQDLEGKDRVATGCLA